ncbi:MAG: carbohydrate-binding domain-containing protein [Oscillospiraceae bacterium]|nr:carbohydrate-binding domain-containing protein [Oscillospiraceae bacterium]
MKKMSHYLYAAILTCAMFGMTGCSALTQDVSTEVTESQAPSSSQPAAESEASSAEKAGENKTSSAMSEKAASSAASGTKLDTSSLFTDRDMTQTADTAAAQTIEVRNGETITVSEEGIYLVKGSATDCTILVNADEQAKVQLVLDNVSITNSDFPAIYVESADKVFVTSTGENLLAVTGTFRADGETNADAVIFSRQDVTLNGTGSLTINSGEGNGITGKDDLKITGGTYSITSALDAIEANDSISVCDGTFTIETQKDGLHCENDEGGGDICITGGTFTINAKSDGIQATNILQIDGGTFNVNGSEGLEATYVQINDGKIRICATDDGINATVKGASRDVVVEVNGGELTIEVGPGDTDAIDVNGSVYVNGGTISITAQMSSFDYDNVAEFNGGTIIINGEEVSEIPQSMMGGGFGRGGKQFDGSMPEGMEPPQGFDGSMPEGMEPPQGFDGSMPEGMEPPQGFDGSMPEGMEPPQGFDGNIPENAEGYSGRHHGRHGDFTQDAAEQASVI